MSNVTGRSYLLRDVKNATEEETKLSEITEQEFSVDSNMKDMLRIYEEFQNKYFDNSNSMAIQFAREKHHGVTRKFSGEPYVNHCIRVSDTVALHTTKATVITAAVLHDTLEDTSATYEEIEEKFGTCVAVIVLALTNDDVEMAKAGGKRDYLASKINTLTKDQLLIKLADRLDNVSDLSDNKWSRKYCEETRHIFLETLTMENLNSSHIELLEQIHKRVLACELLFEKQTQ